MNITELRLKWLRHLKDNGPSKRDGWGANPCWCMRNGLTDWVDVKAGDLRERLTPLGLSIVESLEWVP